MSEHRLWPERLNPIIEEFSECFDSMERYELLFQYAKSHPSPLPQEEWTDTKQVNIGSVDEWMDTFGEDKNT